MHKRGMKHVEAVLSFVFFIGFAISAIYFLNPYSLSKPYDNSIERIYSQIAENSTVKIEKYAVFISEDANMGGGEGAGTPNLVVVSLGRPIESNSVIRAIDLSGSDVKASISDESKGEIVLNYNRPKKEILQVYISEDLEPNEFQGSQRVFPQPGKERNYQIASYYYYNAVSSKRIGALKKEYDSYYSSMKEYFAVPKDKEFSFAFGNIKAEKKVQEGRDIFAKRERVEALTLESGINDAISFNELGVKIW